MISSNRFLPWLFALVLLACPALARANIGDDLPTLRQRYGSAQILSGQALFQHDGYSICAYFDGSHVGMEVFCRDGSVKGKTDITDKDIEAILAAEGEGLTWAPYTTPRGQPVWIRLDHKVIARLSAGDNPGDKFLTIMLNDKPDATGK